jgi:hypothetical protein
MGEINMHMPIRAYFVVLVVLIAALLAGCGSSSKTSSSSTNASAATTTTGAKVATTTGTKAAKGPNAGHFKRAGARVSSPAFKAALAKFATCLRQNGVNIAPPNTSGKGPVFSAKGINTASAQFRTAERKCSATLRGGFGASPRGGASRTAGATSAAGQTKPSPAPKPKVKVPPKVTHALQQFTACMREHGVTSFPEPEGATFNTSHSHLDPKSAQYKAAEKKCNPILNAAF